MTKLIKKIKKLWKKVVDFVSSVRSKFKNTKEEPEVKLLDTYVGVVLSNANPPEGLEGLLIYINTESHGVLQFYNYKPFKLAVGSKVSVSVEERQLTEDVKALAIESSSILAYPKPEPKPEPEEEEKDIYDGKPPGHYVGWSDPKKHPMNNWEPFHSGEVGKVESFLWKPESDNTHRPVVVVSCDKVPRKELHIEIFSEAGNLLSVPVIKKSRGNRIHKYARINFYLGQTKEQLAVHGELTVKFYQKINNKTYLKIKIRNGKDYGYRITVDNPANRKDVR